MPDPHSTKRWTSHKLVAPITIIAAIDDAWLAWAHARNNKTAYPVRIPSGDPKNGLYD
jgi:hypothetical protein